MSEQGYAVEVNVEAQGSELDVAALATDTVLVLGDASEYDPGDTVQVADTGAVVASVDTNAGTVTLTAPLGVAADESERVYLVTGGEVAYDYTLTVQLADGEPAEVPIPFESRASWVPGPVDPPIPVTVSDDLTAILDAPGRAQEITGEALVTETVSSDKLTTAAVGGEDLVNGTFEDWQPAGAGALFDGWRSSWWFGTQFDSSIQATSPGGQIAGSVSAVILNSNDTAGYRFITDRTYPVHGGQEVTVTCQVRADRTVDRSASSTPTVVELVIHTSDDTADPETFDDGTHIIWQGQSIDQIDTTVRPMSSTVVVPTGHTKMRVSIGALPSGDGSGWSLIVDEMHRTSPTDTTAPQRVDTLSVGQLDVDSLDSLIIGGRSLASILSDYTRLTVAPTVTTFAATAVRSYDPSGAVILQSGAPADTYARVGYISPTGNRESVVNFDSTTIASTLAGKTISKVEAFLFISSRGGAGTGTIPVGFHSSATPQATYAAVTGKAANVFRPTGWRENVGQWVDVTSTVGDWQTGTKKGLILGPGQTFGGTLSNSLIYSHHVTGMGTSTPPKLRFTYT